MNKLQAQWDNQNKDKHDKHWHEQQKIVCPKNWAPLIRIWEGLTITDKWSHHHTRDNVPVVMQDTWEPLRHRIMYMQGSMSTALLDLE